MGNLEDHSAFNRRAFMRVPLQLTTEVDDGERRFTCHTSDLSFKGLCLVTDADLAAGTSLTVTVAMAEDGSIPPLQVEVSVIGRNPNGIGCAITAILEPESFEHLRRFVLYNAEDADLALEEINDYLRGQATNTDD